MKNQTMVPNLYNGLAYCLLQCILTLVIGDKVKKLLVKSMIEI